VRACARAFVPSSCALSHAAVSWREAVRSSVALRVGVPHAVAVLTQLEHPVDADSFSGRPVLLWRDGPLHVCPHLFFHRYWPPPLSHIHPGPLPCTMSAERTSALARTHHHMYERAMHTRKPLLAREGCGGAMQPLRLSALATVRLAAVTSELIFPP
jgi:hypothetical protein